jgi:uncharacterized protein (TIGR03083 family)
MDGSTETVKIMQAECTRLHQYLSTLPPEAWCQPSACAHWQIQDVVAHLVGVAEFYTDTLSRGLHGDTTPPEGFPAAGTVNASAMAEPIAHMARATREHLGDQVCTAFAATMTRLHALLAEVGTEAWARLCYHPWRRMPVRQFLAMTLQEVVLHGWDIRSRLAPEATLAPESLPALLELIATSHTSGFLGWAFRPGPRLAVPRRYRFAITGPVPSRLDIVVEGDQAHIAPATVTAAAVTCHCDPETYVLVMYGRLSLEAAHAVGRLRLEGEQGAIADYGQWFKGA